MFTLRQLLKEVKINCSNLIGHVRDMRTYAKDNPGWESCCRDIVCDGCDVPAQAKRWLAFRGIRYGV
ncbi:hypothetical protein LCGC14_2182000 [marine sediment metagenome]|uniref:Uncharacterized protein n=1 Tax=marine sediment metagenome TaxID=412755 RepID=A0A0F9E998_9ZZZZ